MARKACAWQLFDLFERECMGLTWAGGRGVGTVGVPWPDSPRGIELDPGWLSVPIVSIFGTAQSGDVLTSSLPVAIYSVFLGLPFRCSLSSCRIHR